MFVYLAIQLTDYLGIACAPAESGLRLDEIRTDGVSWSAPCSAALTAPDLIKQAADKRRDGIFRILLGWMDSSITPSSISAWKFPEDYKAGQENRGMEMT
ncbi:MULTISPECIES: hypothetical protein [Comamonas]|uniref:hypothetical protein n=1 Tax=Comamonas TaxID=283 RepID=UPI00103A7BFC|nr:MULTISPECIES: hypothetical protein [Comamonas]TYK70238.1 hypothetical protein FSY45_25105 [Comamonas sp. Z1]